MLLWLEENALKILSHQVRVSSLENCFEGSALSWLGHDHGSLVQGLGSRNFIYSKHPVAFGNSFLDLQPCDNGCGSFSFGVYAPG